MVDFKLLMNNVSSQVVLVVKNPPDNAGDIRDAGSIPGLGRFPWRRTWQPTPVFLPGKSMDKGAWRAAKDPGSAESMSSTEETVTVGQGSLLENSMNRRVNS